MSAIAALLILTTSTSAQGSDPSDICTREALRIASDHGVPPALAAAIIQAESSGRPYAIGATMGSSVPRTRSDAEAQVNQAINLGRCIDVGCMQINSCSHGHRVGDVTRLLDPATNVRVGITYLKELFDRSGDWITAAGNFHSHTPLYNQIYRCRLAVVFDPWYRSERCDLAQQLAARLRGNGRTSPAGHRVQGIDDADDDGM